MMMMMMKYDDDDNDVYDDHEYDDGHEDDDDDNEDDDDTHDGDHDHEDDNDHEDNDDNKDDDDNDNVVNANDLRIILIQNSEFKTKFLLSKKSYFLKLFFPRVCFNFVILRILLAIEYGSENVKNKFDQENYNEDKNIDYN